MSQVFEETRLRIVPGHERDLVAMSDALELWSSCERLACRRSGGCRGFADRKFPRCLVLVCARLRACFAEYAAPLPVAAQYEPSLAEELQERLLQLIGRELDGFERAREAKEGKEAW